MLISLLIDNHLCTLSRNCFKANSGLTLQKKLQTFFGFKKDWDGDVDDKNNNNTRNS